MAPLHGELEPAAHREFACGEMVRVGAGGERVDADRDRDAAQQVGGEEKPAVHHDDGGEFLSGIGLGDVGGEFTDAAADRLRIVEGGECNGHRGDQAPFEAAFLRVSVVEYPGTNGMKQISDLASSNAARSAGSSESIV